jgi:hypothetical protein
MSNRAVQIWFAALFGFLLDLSPENVDADMAGLFSTCIREE